MSGLLLLRPRCLALAGRWRTADRTVRQRSGVLLLLAAVFWLVIFAFFTWVLRYFESIPEFGPVLTERLLAMVLLSFFSILVFSSIVTALSTYYLSADLGLLLASPVSRSALHTGRFLETLWDSSWMIVLFGLPIFLAYGVVHHAGPAFYAMVAAVFPPFLVLPCALGVTITMLLMRAFPARDTKDFFLLLSVITVALLYVYLRLLQPQRLLRPEEFSDFLQFIAAIQTPASPFLPSAWATNALIPFLKPRPGQRPLLQYLALATTSAAACVACSMIAERIHASGFSRSQSARRARVTRLPRWDRLFARLPMSQVTRALVLKDVKTFVRDTTQWSQLILLGALVVVYVYNFRALPPAQSLLAQFYLDHLLAFLNLSLAGFVMSSVAVRMLFPSISLEGKAFWLLQSAPIAMSSVWRSKFWSGVGPLGGLGLLLLVLGNHALGVGGVTLAVSVVTLALMTFPIAALGLWLGGLYARLDHENAAKIPSSFGGIVYMIVTILFIGLNALLEAWPIWTIVSAGLARRPLAGIETALIGASFAAVVAINMAVFALATRNGIRALENLRG
jgi:ABC-2 type transport system permease protein